MYQTQEPTTYFIYPLADFSFKKLSDFAAQSKENHQHFENDMVKWLYYLKNIQNMSGQDLKSEQDPIFRKLLEQCKYSNLTSMEQEEYKKSLLEYEGIRDAIECAREDAAMENFEQGLKYGREEGRKKMLFQMAKKMLELGVPLEDVVRETGVDREESTMENGQ